MRTIEYLPDTTPEDRSDNDRNIVYLNEFGQVLLRNVVQTDDSTHVAASQTVSGQTVTVTSNGHGLTAGDRISIDGGTIVLDDDTSYVSYFQN